MPPTYFWLEYFLVWKRAPQAPLALRPCPLQARQHTFSDALPLELGNRPEDVHLELPCWRRGIDAFSEAYERHAERLEIFQQRGQMLQVATKPIQVEITIYMTIN